MNLLRPILLGLAVGALAAWLFSNYAHLLPHSSTSYADAVTKAAPAVVNIYTSKLVRTPQATSEKKNFYYHPPNPVNRQLSLGSGVIISKHGYIVTNYHVIRDAEEILISLFDGRNTMARIIGVDQETDLAILKINLAPLTAISAADTKSMHVGDAALAIGNPFGFGQSVTAGIISATGRYGLNLNTYENYIQTDAAINIGNSGGALINDKGQLIGINAAIYSQNGSSQGIGLAIPVDIVNKVSNDLIRFGHVIRGWLGLEVTQLNDALAKKLNIQQTSGLMITNIYRNSPAETAGLLPADIILRINNKHIENGQEGLLEVANLEPGKSVVVEIIRANQRIIIPLIVGVRPSAG